ncbi:hypothetical protein F7725_023065 [Dissostichus mawsoni]|uniref:UPAR/Ly6 domain-containing protein n=1 Tax=Dissostichus mawsoni TaxID=36200 RepID=A0A7J5Z003_DISMA|nr:hypothetical protein F7725_023065 [Dissostichus mawsoni]
MAAALFLPSLSLDSLLCNFCPLQHKGTSCPEISSQCLPHQRCSSSRGYFGSLHVLSAQGCVDAELCGSHEMASFEGSSTTSVTSAAAETNVEHVPAPAGCCSVDLPLLPSLLCANMRCYYSPILKKGRNLISSSQSAVLMRCALRQKGCMAKKGCSRVHKIRIRGTFYTMSYGCCDSPYCNSCPGVFANPIVITLTLLTVAVMAGIL